MAGALTHIDTHIVKSPNKKKSYMASIIDDATRIVYIEIIPDRRAQTLALYMKRAHKWFSQRGIIIESILSDNGTEFTTHHTSRAEHSFEKVLGEFHITHRYTRIRRPQTNGKIERFWRTLDEEFIYRYSFTSPKEFRQKLNDWITYYNIARPHEGIHGLTPIEKFEKLQL